MVKHIPNFLSLFRIFDLVIVIVLMEYNCTVLAAIFFGLGILSDILDGHIARNSNAVTTAGKLLDPLADKIFVIGILTAMIKIIDLPYWIVIVIIARELAVTGLRSIAASENVVISADKLGKFKTTTQFISIVVLILGFREIGIYLLVFAMIMTVISGYSYFNDYFKGAK